MLFSVAEALVQLSRILLLKDMNVFQLTYFVPLAY